MSQTRQGQLDTLKNNRLLTLKASHALIFYRKNSGFHYLKDEKFAFVSALSSFKNASSFRSYKEKSEIAVLWPVSVKKARVKLIPWQIQAAASISLFARLMSWPELVHHVLDYRSFHKLCKFLNLVDVKNLKYIKNAFAEGKMNENFNGKRKTGGKELGKRRIYKFKKDNNS